MTTLVKVAPASDIPPFHPVRVPPELLKSTWLLLSAKTEQGSSKPSNVIQTNRFIGISKLLAWTTRASFTTARQVPNSALRAHYRLEGSPSIANYRPFELRAMLCTPPATYCAKACGKPKFTVFTGTLRLKQALNLVFHCPASHPTDQPPKSSAPLPVSPVFKA